MLANRWRSRSVVLMLIIVMVLLLPATVFAGGSREPAEADPDRPFAGTTLTFVAQPDVFAEPLRSLLPAFEAETGIRVEMETLPYSSLRERQVAEFTAGASDLDIMTMDIVWMGEFVENGWIAPLNEYFARDAAEINPDDFLPGAMQGLALWDGDYYGMPLGAYYYLYFYRTDVLAEQGLEPAVTLDEFIEVARATTAPPNMYGFSSGYRRGAPLVHDSVSYMTGLGGSILADFPNDNTPNMNSDAARRTYEFYIDMLNYAPPGAETFDFTARREVFQQGIVSQIGNWSSSGGAFVDPNSSQRIVTENLGVGYLPRASREADPYVPFGGWSLVINANSPNRDAAWEFFKWFASPEVQETYTVRGGTPFRFSTLQDPELQQGREWFQLILDAEANGWVDPEVRPRFSTWPELEEQMGLRLSEIVSGDRGIAEGLDLLNRELTEILQRAGEL
jgi:multiple sugar transport system substrate-binding protein